MSGIVVLGVDTGPKSHGMACLVVLPDGTARFLASATADAPSAADRCPRATVGYDLRADPIDIVAIECPEHSFSAATATPIIATAKMAGELGGACKVRGYTVEYLTAATWRAGLLGSASAHDAAVKAFVEANVQGLPKKTNVHVRDAMALAVYAGRQWLRRQVAA